MGAAEVPPRPSHVVTGEVEQTHDFVSRSSAENAASCAHDYAELRAASELLLARCARRQKRKEVI